MPLLKKAKQKQTKPKKSTTLKQGFCVNCPMINTKHYKLVWNLQRWGTKETISYHYYNAVPYMTLRW